MYLKTKHFVRHFESMKKTYQNLISASEVDVQSDKAGIGEDAVSVVIPGAVVYMPLEDLVDMEKRKRASFERRRAS